MINNVSSYYDALIDKNNDPIFDPEPLKKHMDRWDGSAFIDLLDLNVSKSVLEIGVGTGRLVIRIAPLCRTFTGIDISEKTVEKAKQNLKRFNNVTLIHGDFSTFVFFEKYDVIYSSLTFMHFNNKADTIAKIYSLLNPSGNFVLSIDKSKNKYIECNGRTIEIYPDDPETTKTHLHNAKFVVESVIETEAAYLFSAKK